MDSYTDASFDKFSRRSFVGYCNDSMTVSKVVRRKFDNVNLAELYALNMAIKDLGDNHVFHSDSIFAVETLSRPNVL